MGRLKQTLPIGGRPAVRLCLESIIEAGIGEVVVVAGHGREEVADAIRGLPVKIAFNEKPGSEMAESVRAGMRETDGRASGIVICLSDHPLVRPSTIRLIAERHMAFPDDIIVPAYKGRHGHPSLFPLHCLGDLAEGANLRQIKDRYPGRLRLLDMDDRGVVLDMDTNDDYETICRIASAD